MNHRKMQEKILTCHDTELPDDERQAITAHLESCKECREILSRWERIGTVLSRTEMPAPSENFVNRVMAHLPWEEPASEPAQWPWPFPRWAIPAIGYAFAIFLFFAALLPEEPLVNTGAVLLANVPQETQWTFSGEPPEISTLLAVKEGK